MQECTQSQEKRCKLDAQSKKKMPREYRRQEKDARRLHGAIPEAQARCKAAAGAQCHRAAASKLEKPASPEAPQ